VSAVVVTAARAFALDRTFPPVPWRSPGRPASGGAGAAGGRAVLAAGDLVAEQEFEEVGVREVVLAGEGDSFGQGGQQLDEFEGCAVVV